MVVLLTGGSSVLMNALIDKLNKNGHRVYLLTGQRDRRVTYKRVFERYDFACDSGSVKDIVESIRPDVTVFTGAYDTNYDWELSAREESVRYLAGLVNVLSACSMAKSGRFLYLSSEEVFGNTYAENIREEEPAEPKGFRALALAQGEETCANYRRTQGTDAAVVRLDHLYWVPKKGEQEDNPCFRMCLEGLKTGKISAGSNHTLSLLYLSDAVELIYKLICAEAPAHALYHISSMEPVTELALAEMIRDEADCGVEVTDVTVGMNSRLVLDSSRYDEEFPHRIFHDCRDGVRQVMRYMKKHSASFLTEEDQGVGAAVRTWKYAREIFWLLVPFLESTVLFFLAFFLNGIAADSEFIARLDIYLLYVLLLSVVHGQQQAVYSALLATAGYCFGQMQGRTGFEVLLDYNTYVWMAHLFIVGLTVGYLKDQLRFMRNEHRSKVGYLSGQLKDIEEINDSNVRMKHNFEEQVVNHKESLGKIYEISSTLEQYGPEEVLFYAAQVLSRLMDSPDVAVYTVANGDYARLFSATSPEARRLGNSIKYTAMEDMYGELKARRVYVNREMEENMPMMACAVYAEDDMQLILMVWSLPWQRMTLGEANRLMVVGHLIQNAVVHANRYLEALRNRRYVEGTNVLDEEAFTHLAKAFSDARDKGLAEYMLLEILTEENYESVAAVLGKAIRQTDYLGLLRGGRLYALLPNTGPKYIGDIISRFQNCGYECRVDEEAVI